MRNILLSSLVLALGTTACATKSASTVTTEGTGAHRPAPVARPEPAPAPPQEAEELDPLDFGPIFYALDSSRLTPESQQTLEKLALVLRQRSEAKVTIAGHTCELGTTEYNLALGQQRAAVARDYLVRMGVEPSRILLTSYGEESPRAAGHSEEAFQQNRRSEFSFSVEYAQRVNR
jgi:peptidoglycan-associated lipoprotein